MTIDIDAIRKRGADRADIPTLLAELEARRDICKHLSDAQHRHMRQINELRAEVARLATQLAATQNDLRSQTAANTAYANENDRLKRQLAEWQGSSNAYLIWSNHHQAWWGPNSSGYRTNIADAGRYSLDAAKRELHRGCYCCQVPEVVMPVPLPGQMDSASLIALTAKATQAEIDAGRVNQCYEPKAEVAL